MRRINQPVNPGISHGLLSTMTEHTNFHPSGSSIHLLTSHYPIPSPFLQFHKMAKTKKSGDTITSRLALVMKSGKGKSCPARTWNRTVLTVPSHHGQQVDHEDSPLRQGQVDPHLCQLPAPAQVRARVLRDARKDPSAPLQWQQRTSNPHSTTLSRVVEAGSQLHYSEKKLASPLRRVKLLSDGISLGVPESALTNSCID